MRFSATLLVSRQALFPCAQTPWICAVKDAVSYLSRRGFRLVSSCGVQSWDVQTALASELKLPLELIIPVETDLRESTIKHLCREFRLSSELTNFRTFAMNRSGWSKKRHLQCRDRLVVTNADIVLPISIRPNGHLDKLLKAAREEGRDIYSKFRVPYTSGSSRVAYPVHGTDVHRQTDAALSGFLIHWTRAHRTPWPGETAYSFYSSLIRSPTYPRTAMDTLCNILAEKRIRGTSVHIRNGHQTVSFTDEFPSVFAERMRWRSRFRSMSFEPYGIAVRRETAEAYGILPVIYQSEKEDSRETAPWRMQSRGTKTDWRGEKEFRCRGDFDFSRIDTADLLCVCPTEKEASRLTTTYGISSISLFSDTKVVTRSPEACGVGSAHIP